MRKLVLYSLLVLGSLAILPQAEAMPPPADPIAWHHHDGRHWRHNYWRGSYYYQPYRYYYNDPYYYYYNDGYDPYYYNDGLQFGIRFR